MHSQAQILPSYFFPENVGLKRKHPKNNTRLYFIFLFAIIQMMSGAKGLKPRVLAHWW